MAIISPGPNLPLAITFSSGTLIMPASDPANKRLSVEIEYLREFLTYCHDRIVENETPQNQADYYYTLHGLAEKYLNLYTRVTLDSDPEANLIELDIKTSAHAMGMTIGGNPKVYFRQLMIECKQRIVELTGEDLDKEVDLS